MCNGNWDDIAFLDGFTVTKTIISDDQRRGDTSAPPKVQEIASTLQFNIADTTQKDLIPVEKSKEYKNENYVGWYDRKGAEHFGYRPR